MSSRRILLLVAIAFAAHAIEEYATHFYTTDSSVLWLASSLSTQPFLVWVLVQVLLAAFLAVVYVFRKHKMLWAILLLVMVSELYHLLVAVMRHEYSGVLTSLLFLPLLWFVYRTSPLRQFRNV